MNGEAAMFLDYDDFMGWVQAGRRDRKHAFDRQVGDRPKGMVDVLCDPPDCADRADAVVSQLDARGYRKVSIVDYGNSALCQAMCAEVAKMSRSMPWDEVVRHGDRFLRKLGTLPIDHNVLTLYRPPLPGMLACLDQFVTSALRRRSVSLIWLAVRAA